jgi:hypothetical protein
MILKRCTPDLIFHRRLRKVIIESSLRIFRRLPETPNIRERRYDESAHRFPQSRSVGESGWVVFGVP